MKNQVAETDTKFFEARIYALTDFDDNIFYIGCTTGLLSKRLRQHISSANMNWKNSKRCKMIRSLDFKILIKELFLFGLYATDGKDMIQRSIPIEDFFIRKYERMGNKLCNSYKIGKTIRIHESVLQNYLRPEQNS